MLNPSCPHCRTAILSEVAIRQQWCSLCRKFAYADDQEVPVRLNLVLADVHAGARRHAENRHSHVRVAFEQFTHPSVPFSAWRCYAELDGKLVKSSVRPHPNPADALRELSELLAPS